MAEPHKIAGVGPGVDPPVSAEGVAVDVTLPLVTSPQGRGDLPPSESDTASVFTTTAIPTVPEAPPPVPHAVRIAPPPGAAGETPGPSVLTEIVDPRLADQLESDIAELAAAMPEMGDFFETRGFSYLVERIREGKSIPTYVVWNTGADYQNVTSLLQGPVRDHDMPFTFSSALHYADAETGLRHGLKTFAVKRHFPHFTVEVTLSLVDLVHWFATHQTAIRKEGNFIRIRHEFLGEWIGFARTTGRLRILALPGADRRHTEAWDEMTEAARTMGVEVAIAGGELFSVVEAYEEEGQQGPLARALDCWTGSLIGPLLKERLSLLERIRALATQMVAGHPVYDSEMAFLDDLRERTGLTPQIFRGLWYVIEPEVRAPLQAFLEKYVARPLPSPLPSRPPGSDAPLPGSFRDVTNATLEVPGGEPISYTRIRPQKANGSVVIFVRGYGAAHPIETHVLAKELVGRGYTLYSYTPPVSIEWDLQASHLKDLSGIVRRENEHSPVHLIGASFGANVMRRFLEKNQNSVASAVFTSPAFELTPGIARRHGLATTLYPPESPVMTLPTFWLFAAYDAVVVNGRAEADLRFFVGHHEQVTYAVHHELYAGDFDAPARAIADWFDRHTIFATAFSGSDRVRFFDLVEEIASRTDRTAIEAVQRAAKNFRRIRVSCSLESIHAARTLLRDGMVELSDDSPPNAPLFVRDGLSFLRLMGLSWMKIDQLLPGAEKFRAEHTGQSEHRVSPPGTFGYSDPVAQVGPHITETPEFRQAMEIEPGHVVLDPMTGPGVKAVALARAHPGAQVLALEVNPESLLEAATLADSQNISPGSLLFYQNDVHQGLPPHDSTVDRVVINGYATFGFSEDQATAFFAEVFRVLKPGGRLWMDFRHYTAPVGSKHVALLVKTARSLGVVLREIPLGRHMNAVAYEVVQKPAEERPVGLGPSPKLPVRAERARRIGEEGTVIRERWRREGEIPAGEAGVLVAKKRLREALEIVRRQMPASEAGCGTVSRRVRERLMKDWGIPVAVKSTSNPSFFHAYNTYRLPGTDVEIIIDLTWSQFLKPKARHKYPPFLIGTREDVVRFYETVIDDLKIAKRAAGTGVTVSDLVDRYYEGYELIPPPLIADREAGSGESSTAPLVVGAMAMLVGSSTGCSFQDGGGLFLALGALALGAGGALALWLHKRIRESGEEQRRADDQLQQLQRDVEALRRSWEETKLGLAAAIAELRRVDHSSPPSDPATGPAEAGPEEDAIAIRESVGQIAGILDTFAKRFEGHRKDRVYTDPERVFRQELIEPLQSMEARIAGEGRLLRFFREEVHPVLELVEELLIPDRRDGSGEMWDAHANLAGYSVARLRDRLAPLARELGLEPLFPPLSGADQAFLALSGDDLKAIPHRREAVPLINGIRTQINILRTTFQTDTELVSLADSFLPKLYLTPTESVSGYLPRLKLLRNTLACHLAVLTDSEMGSSETGSYRAEAHRRLKQILAKGEYTDTPIEIAGHQVEVGFFGLDHDYRRPPVVHVSTDKRFVAEALDGAPNWPSSPRVFVLVEIPDGWGNVELEQLKWALRLRIAERLGTRPDQSKIQWALGTQTVLELAQPAPVLVREAERRSGVLPFPSSAVVEPAVPLTRTPGPGKPTGGNGGGNGHGSPPDVALATDVLGKGTGHRSQVTGQWPRNTDRRVHTGWVFVEDGTVAEEGNLAVEVKEGPQTIDHRPKTTDEKTYAPFDLAQGRRTHLLTYAQEDLRTHAPTHLRTRLISLAHSRGLPEVAQFLSRLNDDQVTKLVRASPNWMGILTKRGFHDLAHRLSRADPLSATDRFLIASAALARSQASLEKLASNLPNSNAIPPPAGIPTTGLATPALGLANPVLNVVR